MSLELRPLQTEAEFKQFVVFPWKVNRGDPNWVPPLIEERSSRLDEKRNSFWGNTRRLLWMAWQDGQPVGTIAAFIDLRRNRLLHTNMGQFGFFDCVNDPSVSRLLIAAAGNWLRSQAVSQMVGPYNPSMSDEAGILVEGFDTRPTIMTAHNPPYYPALMEDSGLIKKVDLLARMFRRPDGMSFDQACPPNLKRVYQRVSLRQDYSIRSIRMDRWEEEISLACRIYNAALGPLPDFLPLTEEEFLSFANSFKLIMQSDLALVAEVRGEPAGFALALPDINQALQHVNGRLDLPGMAKFWWYSRRLTRISFKVLMMLPEFQKRGIEALLNYRIGEAIFKRGYQEVDFSLTGEENLPSTLYQENAGMQIYRRYRIYQMELA